MSDRVSLTKWVIERLPIPGEGEARPITYDEQVRGLAVVVQPSGKRSFIWLRKVRGKVIWKTIADWPTYDVEQARRQAQAWNTAAADWKAGGYQGPSPFAKQNPANVLTLDKLLEEYIARHLSAHAKRPDAAEKEVRWTVRKYLSEWNARPLGEISREDVRNWHLKAKTAHGTRTANRVCKVLRALYRFAIRAELWEGTPPTSGLTFYHEAKRDRYLQPDELAKLWTALRHAPNKDLADFVNIALFTGARKGDIFSMRWTDLDLNGGNVWTVPDPKSRVPYRIPLDDEVVKILKARQRNTTKILKARQPNTTADLPWVFPSRGASGHLMDLKGRWREVLIAAGLDYPNEPGRRPCIHDLRRTYGSWQAALGTSLPIIGKSLGHASAQATAIYARVNTDVVRASTEAANNAMRKAMRKKPKLLKPAPRRKVAARA